MSKAKKIIIACLSCAVIAVLVVASSLLIDVYGVADYKDYFKDVEFSEGPEITVMTYNIKCVTTGTDREISWSNRRSGMMEQIASVAPDILCMQEVKAMQESFLTKKLGEKYGYVYQYRSDDYLAKEAVPVFYNKERFELVKSDSFWLSETPDKMSIGWDAALERICTYVRLTDKRTGNDIAVYSTHFDHMGETARIESARLIISRMSKEEIPAILLGDLNFGEGEEPYTFITQSLTDTKYDAAVSENSNTYNGYRDETKNDPPIDFIFHNGKFTTASYDVLNEKADGIYLSDHFPIVAEISFK